MDLALRRTLLFFMAACAVLQGVLMLRLEVNWDEFLNLSMVYDHRRGDLREILQTAFVQLFRWVPSVSDNEVEQVVAARGVIAVFAFVTTAMIWLCARRLMSFIDACFAVFAYWSFSYVLQHGLALRTDTLAAAPIMVAIWLALTRAEHAWAALLAGGLVGLAGVLTIKAVFFLPTLVLLAMLRAQEERTWMVVVRQILLAALAAGVVFGSLIGLHALTFHQAADPLAFLKRTSQATLGDNDGSIFRSYFLFSIWFNPVCFVVLFVGFATALVGTVTGSSRRASLQVLAFSFSAFVPFVYRDTYPYFYALILPPLAVVMAMGFNRIRVAGAGWRGFAVLGAMASFWAINGANALLQTNRGQHVILDVIHENFPDERHYIDARSMVSSFRKQGLFMSAWGMTDYRNQGSLVMEDILRTTPPSFLLANGPGLSLDSLTPEMSDANPFGLFAEDLAILKSNFVPYWGPIWVPGRIITPSDTEIEIFLGGSYRNQGPEALAIGAASVGPDETIDLVPGLYSVTSAGPVTLSLDVPPVAVDPPAGPVFRGFQFAPISILPKR